MRFTLSLLTLVSLTTATTPHDARDTLKYRNWDLHLLKPGCVSNSSNIDLSLYHASGVNSRACVALDQTTDLDLGAVDSVSWKSPTSTRYDLCMFAEGDCGGEAMGVIRNGWEVCYRYAGWKGYKVVGADEACV